MHPPDPHSANTRTLKRQLALNLMAALRVAGPARAGKANKLRQIDVMRSTGMSRTTLRPLLDTSNRNQRNPDLVTLHKLAHAIGVPLAFLLMSPDDWRRLAKISNGLGLYRTAAEALVTDELGSPAIAEIVLKRCKVHPDRPPMYADPQPEELKRLDARNEWRRRCSLVLAALAQPAARGERSFFVELTALSAALANAMTPHDPTANPSA